MNASDNHANEQDEVATADDPASTTRQLQVRIGERLKTLRQKRRYSLEQLARKTGHLLKKSAISNYEHGHRPIGAPEAFILAKALDEHPAHILCLDRDDMTQISKEEEEVLKDLRELPPEEFDAVASAVAATALLHRTRKAVEPDISDAEAARMREALARYDRKKAGKKK